MKSIQIIKGQRIKLQDFSASKILEVEVNIIAPQNIGIEIFCFALDNQDKLSDKRNLIFINQKKSPCGSIQCTGISSNLKFQINLNNLSPTIYKLSFVVSIKGENTMSQIQNGYIRLSDSTNELLRFTITGSDFKSEKAIIYSEIYLKDVWRICGVGQGFNGGIDQILNLYGVDNTLIKSLTPQMLDSSFNFQKVSGKINLTKGQKPIIIEKTPEIVASISWRSGTDYDIYALVLAKNGNQIDVATFGASGVAALINYGNGAVVHMGDVIGGGDNTNTETIKIRLNDNILAVVPVAYSAQSNGSGSFYDYKVSMLIDNHQGTKVTISAENAEQNPYVYTCVPGIIKNTEYGVIIEVLEFYSEEGSELRPKLLLEKGNNVRVIMDAGPQNDYK